MTEFDCGNDWLVAYADGELTGNERWQGSEHVAGCARCQAELAALQASLNQVQVHWRTQPSLACEPMATPRRVMRRSRASALFRAAVVAGVALTLVWQLKVQRESAVAPPKIASTNDDMNTDTSIDDWLQRETQMARLRAASELLAQEPGMRERGEQLEQYLLQTYGN